jgi:hypothetical protein
MKNTTDLFFAAFLRVAGYKIIDFEVMAKGKGRFYFEISEQAWKEERIKFNESIVSRVKQEIEQLKDMVY